MTHLIQKLAASSIVLASLLSTSAFAADSYKVDPSHAQILYSYNHLGFSTTWGLFSGFDGEVTLDEADISKSTVKIDIQLDTLLTGWEARDGHFKSPDFFNIGEFPVASFVSKSVEATGENTAKITGDLTIVGVTKEIVLDTKLNQIAQNPLNQKDWAGFDASATLKRSDFGLGLYAPAVSDEIDLKISVELEKL